LAGECLEPKRIALATVFGVVIFLSKAVAPSPLDKMFIVVHALLLALGALLLKRMGATYVALIGGTLAVLWRATWAPFSLVFALLYGLFVDGFLFLFKVRFGDGQVKTSRLVAAMTVCTAILGFMSYYTTVLLLGLLERNLLLELSILVVGTINGTVAGYLASIVWNKYLKSIKL
jgi:hypothetical protein